MSQPFKYFSILLFFMVVKNNMFCQTFEISLYKILTDYCIKGQHYFFTKNYERGGLCKE